jgi:hypothetical protein
MLMAKKSRAETVTLAEHLRSISAKGGKARMAGMSEAEKQKLRRKGGLAGGKARAASLSPARKRKIASDAAKAMWAKKRAEKARDRRT